MFFSKWKVGRGRGFLVEGAFAKSGESSVSRESRVELSRKTNEIAKEHGHFYTLVNRQSKDVCSYWLLALSRRYIGDPQHTTICLYSRI